MLATWSHWKYHSTLPQNALTVIVDTEYTDTVVSGAPPRPAPPQNDKKIPECFFFFLELTQERLWTRSMTAAIISTVKAGDVIPADFHQSKNCVSFVPLWAFPSSSLKNVLMYWTVWHVAARCELDHSIKLFSHAPKSKMSILTNMTLKLLFFLKGWFQKKKKKK